MKTTDVYQMITDRLVSLLENGVCPWSRPWIGGGSPRNLCSRHRYSGINVWILASAGYSSPYWLTFRQAKKLGGHVRKGERGTPIVFYSIVERKRRDEKGEVETVRIPMIRYFTVFNLEQVAGVEAPADEVAAIDFEEIPECAAVVDGMPMRPEIRHGAGQASYRPSTDTVSMPDARSFKSEEGYYATLFHELAHATGHASRLGRGVEKTAAFGSATYSKEELVAEMASSFLCGVCGIEAATITNSAAYLAGWIQALKGDAKLAIGAASAAQKAADFILGRKPAGEEKADDE